MTNNTNAAAVFLTEQQVADLICQSVRTIQKWRITGSGPHFHKFGQSVRYSLGDVKHWVAERRVSHTSQ
jgi:predicted DNA-binding transcriptional regulator AlpA